MQIDTLDLAAPGGASSGDTLAVVVFSDQPITAPAGWNEFLVGVAGGIHYSACSRQLSALDIANKPLWAWAFAAPTDKVAYDAFVFANITGLDATLITPYETPTSSMDAPSLNVSQNEMVFAFWVANNPTEIHCPTHPGDLGGTYARGQISHLCAIYTNGANGPTGVQTGTLVVPSTGFAAQASLRGAGSHIVSGSGGTLAARR